MDALNKCVEVGCKTKRPPVRKPLLSGTKVLHHQRWIYSMLDSINHRNLSVARRGGQDICGVVIFRFANRFAYVISDDCVTVSQFFQVILNVVDVQRVTFQRGFAVDSRWSPELHRPAALHVLPWYPDDRSVRCGSHPAFHVRQ